MIEKKEKFDSFLFEPYFDDPSFVLSVPLKYQDDPDLSFRYFLRHRFSWFIPGKYRVLLYKSDSGTFHVFTTYNFRRKRKK